MKHIHIAISGFVSGLVILSFSLNIITGLWTKIRDLEFKNMVLSTELEQMELRRAEFTVTGTMYSPTRAQCDATPNITADGTRINPKHASQYRYIALSRDLLNRWGGPFQYGEYVAIEGTQNGKHDGIWQVRDTMNPKWIKRVDFLVTNGTRPFKYNEIKITKLNS
jgi:3D (Asp-Asp-Asp) domain-containing protein|tara:strand:- start:122 stop:619 length:498 start_codon:yes stop_codon:yes gene_type:complete